MVSKVYADGRLTPLEDLAVEHSETSPRMGGHVVVPVKTKREVGISGDGLPPFGKIHTSENIKDVKISEEAIAEHNKLHSIVDGINYETVRELAKAEITKDLNAALDALLQMCELTCQYRMARSFFPGGYREFFWHGYSVQKEDALTLLQRLGRISADQIISPEDAEKVFGGAK